MVRKQIISVNRFPISKIFQTSISFGFDLYFFVTITYVIGKRCNNCRSKMESREDTINALILSANLFLEMDVSSDDEENEAVLFGNYDCPSMVNSSTTAAALKIPRWSGDEYKMHLKLSVETFEFLYQLIGPRLRRLCYGMPMVDAHLQLMVAIHKLTTFKTYRDASEVFQLKKSTGYSCTNRVVTALCDLAPAFIKWPSSAEAEKISRSFEEISGFPGIIGDLGQYRFNLLEFLEKEKKQGILFQFVCDSARRFTHCQMVSPDNAESYEWLKDYIEDASMFPDNTHLIANSCYPLHEKVMVPYKEETDVQKNFNEKLRSASVIGECLGDLLGRFESLQRGLSLNDEMNKTHVVACCVLHNICELKGDKYAGGRVDIEKVGHGSVLCSPKAKMKRDAIALSLPSG